MADFRRAWGVLSDDDTWHSVHKERESAELVHDAGIRLGIVNTLVELVPLPEVEQLVAEAVAAERERCAAIAEEHHKASDRPHPDYAESAVLRACEMIEAKIREVTP